MRHAGCLVGLLALALVTAGCTGSAPGGAAGSPKAAASASTAVDPRDAGLCTQARRVITQATGAMNAEVDKAVAAGNLGDHAGEAAAIASVRATFADWAAKIRAQAARAVDPHLKAMLTQYAGAVDATIASVKSAADLELLITFDHTPLDPMADEFVGLCP